MRDGQPPEQDSYTDPGGDTTVPDPDREKLLDLADGEPARRRRMIDDREQASGSAVDDLPAPPDGGWGWIVCAAAFFCMVITDGMMFSFGVLFLEFLDYFQAGKSQTAMVGSALMGTHLLAGPLTSAMINAWGIRTVAMLGSVLATVAFACNIFARSITVVTVLYGFIGGFGVSMIYLSSLLAVGFYFEKKRALANGITHSGSGIGTFIYSPLTEYLIGQYGWKGTILILSGLVLNCLACSALYIPLAVPRKRKPRPTSERRSGGDLAASGHVLPVSDSANVRASELTRDGAFSSSFPTLTVTSVSTPNLPKTKRNSPTAHQNGTSQRPDESTAPTSLRCRTYSQGEMSKVKDDRPDEDPGVWTTKPLYRKDLFYSGSLIRIPEYQKEHAASLYSIPRQLPCRTDPEASDGHPDTEGASTCQRRIRKRLVAAKSMLLKMTNATLLRSPKFLLCTLVMVTWTTHSSVLTILPDYAVLRGVDVDKAALLLSVIGVTNTAARVVVGWLSDRPDVSCLAVNICALVTGGVCCVGIAFSSSYVLLALESAVFGMCMGTWTSLRPIILVDVLGLENLTNAFGLVAMFQGIAFLVGPPLAGALYEFTQSYAVPFLVAGMAFTTSGALCVLLLFCSSNSCAYCHRKYTPRDLEPSITVEVGLDENRTRTADELT